MLPAQLVVVKTQGRAYQAARGNAAGVYCARMSWSGWAALNGGYAGGIEAIGQDADGRLEAFGLAPAPGGQAAYHNAQVVPNGGWSGWSSIGSPPQNDVLSHLEVAANADGRLEAFLRYGAMSV